MSEEWRPMPDYEGLYEVSTLGRVRSLYFDPPRINVTPIAHDGYRIIMLSKAGRRTPKRLHRLVCRAFHGEPLPSRPEAAHLDGNRANARADNLKWASKIENHFHMRAHGTLVAGERHPCAKLTERDVREILARPGQRATLAQKFGVSVHAIDDIRSGKNWRSVTAKASPELLQTKAQPHDSQR